VGKRPGRWASVRSSLAMTNRRNLTSETRQHLDWLGQRIEGVAAPFVTSG